MGGSKTPAAMPGQWTHPSRAVRSHGRSQLHPKSLVAWGWGTARAMPRPSAPKCGPLACGAGSPPRSALGGDLGDRDPPGTSGLTWSRRPPPEPPSPPGCLRPRGGALPRGRGRQHPATRCRDGWWPGEDPCCSPHPPGAPHPSPTPGLPQRRPHLLLPAALHPGSVIQHGGSRRGGVGCGPSRPPASPRAPRRRAWPGERAPFPVPAVVRPALGCSVPRSAGGCSTFAALSHPTPGSHRLLSGTG